MDLAIGGKRMKNFIQKIGEKGLATLAEIEEDSINKCFFADERVRRLILLTTDIRGVYLDSGRSDEAVDNAIKILNIQSLATDETSKKVRQIKEEYEKKATYFKEQMNAVFLMANIAEDFNQKIQILRDANLVSQDSLVVRPVKEILESYFGTSLYKGEE
ncbi:hypothetical protein [Massilibacteroides sp.]|uniref:hypothetical protein n=1 Tax=Massilibacteroides sp. TaxID=2034766 RepID=UPI00261BF0AD|nr:hypothetical protein [Massilibacteroides sp.]MDD4516567.1 hypothetical protein [Massilibacteroides sp.]